jgi:NAD(P)-dependent dehydrogenase (short-subunit alcohol dehydrogenase family)
MTPMPKTIVIVGALGTIGSAIMAASEGFFNQIISIDKGQPADGSRCNKYIEAELHYENELMEHLAATSGKVDVLVFAQRHNPKSENQTKINIGDASSVENDVFKSAELCSKLVDKKFISSGAKVLFITSSNSTLISGQSLGYHISKAATNVAVKWFAERLLQENITVNGISLGIINKQHDLSPDNLNPTSKTIFDKLFSSSLDGRGCPVMEIGEAVVSFLSQKNISITGQIISIDRGYLLRDPYRTLEILGDN